MPGGHMQFFSCAALVLWCGRLCWTSRMDLDGRAEADEAVPLRLKLQRMQKRALPEEEDAERLLLCGQRIAVKRAGSSQAHSYGSSFPHRRLLHRSAFEPKRLAMYYFYRIYLLQRIKIMLINRVVMPLLVDTAFGNFTAISFLDFVANTILLGDNERRIWQTGNVWTKFGLLLLKSDLFFYYVLFALFEPWSTVYWTYLILGHGVFWMVLEELYRTFVPSF